MTGGKGDPDGVGPSGDPDAIEDCKLTYPGARISSPKNLSKIQKGELLKLDVRKMNGSPVLFAFTRFGIDIGAVTIRSQGQIIHCIERGYQYGAEVMTLEGGECTLTINRTGTP